MASQRVEDSFKELTGQTTTTDWLVLADLDIKFLTITGVLTAGSPATGALLEYTTAPIADIEGGSLAAAEVLASESGYHLGSFSEVEDAASITAVRLAITDGTWTFRVRRRKSTDIKPEQ